MARADVRALSRLAWVAVVALVGLQLAVGILGAAPASAHSTLESSTPAQGSEVAQSPPQVTLHFSEAVGIADDSLRVIDAGGGRVDEGTTHHAAGDTSAIAIGLRAGLPKGSYAVLWHVVSADSHPVSGTFSFGVGVPAGDAPAAQPANSTLAGLHWALTALWYVGAALLIGTAVFVAALWPAGGQTDRVRGLLWAGVGVAGLASAGLYVVQGPYGQGRSLTALGDLRLLRDTLETSAGPLLLLRLIAVGVAVPVLGLRPRRPAAPRAVVALAAVIGLTTALGGHAGQERPVLLAVTADAVHVLAAMVWLGGLGCLLVALLPRAQPAVLQQVLPRWSRLAMGCVGALVVTGSYQAWREVRSLPALTGTEYGRLLLLKLGGLLLLLVLADQGRRWVARLPSSGSPQASSLRDSVFAESIIGVVVLGITALLVSTPPARQAYAAPFSATLVGRDAEGSTISVLVDVPVTKAGAQIVHLYTYTDAGKVLPFTAADATLTERAKGIGPVDLTFAPIGPGHGTAYDVVVPSTGDWTLTVQIKTDPVTDYAATVTYPVQGG